LAVSEAANQNFGTKFIVAPASMGCFINNYELIARGGDGRPRPEKRYNEAQRW
jgi:hypothetical protein